MALASGSAKLAREVIGVSDETVEAIAKKLGGSKVAVGTPRLNEKMVQKLKGKGYEIAQHPAGGYDPVRIGAIPHTPGEIRGSEVVGTGNFPAARGNPNGQMVPYGMSPAPVGPYPASVAKEAHKEAAEMGYYDRFLGARGPQKVGGALITAWMVNQMSADRGAQSNPQLYGQ